MTATTAEPSHMAILEGRFDWDDFEADLHAGLVRSRQQLGDLVRQWIAEGLLTETSRSRMLIFLRDGLMPDAREKYDALPRQGLRFTDDEVRDLRRRNGLGETPSALAQEQGVKSLAMRRLLSGETYGHVAMAVKTSREGV